MTTILALLAAAGYGMSDFSGGQASRRSGTGSTLMCTYPVATLVVCAALPVAPGSLTLGRAACAAAAGLCGLVGFATMYWLMATAPLSHVSPITGVLAAATPLGFGILAGEQPRITALFGIVVGLVAVGLVATAHHSTQAQVRSRTVVLALASGAGFGLYFVLLAHAGAESGLWPLAVARISAVLPVVIVGKAAARRRAPARLNRASMMWAATAGLLDASADVCFLVASRDGLLSLVGVITSLYPAFTITLALVVLRERPGRLARLGLALSVISLALLAG